MLKMQIKCFNSSSHKVHKKANNNIPAQFISYFKKYKDVHDNNIITMCEMQSYFTNNIYISVEAFENELNRLII